MCVLDGATHVKVLVGLKGENKHLLDFIFYQLRYSVWSSLLLGCVVVWIDPHATSSSQMRIYVHFM